MGRRLWIVVLSLMLIITLACMIYIGYLSFQEDYLSTINQFSFNKWFKFSVLETKSIHQIITYENQLVIENIAGNITIGGEDTNEITILAEAKINSNNRERAKSLLEQIELFTHTQDSSTIMVITPPLEEFETANVDLTLTVPKELQAKLNNSQGNIQVSNLSGELEIDTKQGHIELSNFTGNCSLSSSQGDIHITNSTFNSQLHVSAGSGNVTTLGRLARDTSFKLDDGQLSILLPRESGFHITASYPTKSFSTELPLSGTESDTSVNGIIGVADQDNHLLIDVEMGSINIKYY